MPAPQESRDLAVIAATAAASKQASTLVALDVSERLALTDVFVIATGSNERQVQAIVDEVQLKMKEAGAPVQRMEGYQNARWVLADFGAIVVHVQHAEERDFYALERLWHDCPIVPLPDEARGIVEENEA
ncbi:ribosome silencing factor [Bowdeniella nasicola]|uniref:Ribosomal silencing factor RsfS n=1 Tax=Bowdeniella nasicola TaxID=208480 RepID=A0A1Q5Q4C2_9ACTO|nr:ribosome silencing factor [Bowdeniella nasicola]OKL54678.1 ribosome silencing factor [Bowdeniella nasicola]